MILFPAEEKSSSVETQDCQIELLEVSMGLQATVPAQAGVGSMTRKCQGHTGPHRATQSVTDVTKGKMKIW